MSESYDADVFDPDPYIPFATNDVELTFGRWDPNGENASWQSVRVVISELRRDKYGLIIAASNCRGPLSGPIVSSVIDEFFVYESSEFRFVVFLTLFGPVHLVGSQGLRMTLRFRRPLEFHECVRFLSEAKSQLACMRDSLSEQLEVVYNRHCTFIVNLSPPLTASSSALSTAESAVPAPAISTPAESLGDAAPIATVPSAIPNHATVASAGGDVS